MLKKFSLAFAAASLLALTFAQAAPTKTNTTNAGPDDVDVKYQVVVKNKAGKIIGTRSVHDHMTGVLAYHKSRSRFGLSMAGFSTEAL